MALIAVDQVEHPAVWSFVTLTFEKVTAVRAHRRARAAAPGLFPSSFNWVRLIQSPPVFGDVASPRRACGVGAREHDRCSRLGRARARRRRRRSRPRPPPGPSGRQRGGEALHRRERCRGGSAVCFRPARRSVEGQVGEAEEGVAAKARPAPRRLIAAEGKREGGASDGRTRPCLTTSHSVSAGSELIPQSVGIRSGCELHRPSARRRALSPPANRGLRGATARRQELRQEIAVEARCFPTAGWAHSPPSSWSSAVRSKPRPPGGAR